jgi:hypothetical protein
MKYTNMSYATNVNVRRDWVECPKEAREARWASFYASINPSGDIVISGYTHKKLGGTDGYLLLLFDRERQVIGLRPAWLAKDKNAYPARPRGKHGGRRIRGYRLCREFGIVLARTFRFHRCRMDKQGVLILDLNEVRTIGKKSEQW